MARSARSSATRSATASTTRAASSTPTGRFANWWTPEDFAHFKAASASARRAVRRLQAVPRPARERQADARARTSPTSPASRPRTTPIAPLARQAGADAQGLPATSVLPRLRADLAEQGARGARAPADPDRRPRARRSIAPTRCATSTPGTRAFDVKPGQKLYLAPAGPRAGVVIRGGLS